MVRRLECPRCHGEVMVEDDQRPVCPDCGYGRRSAEAAQHTEGADDEAALPPPPDPLAEQRGTVGTVRPVAAVVPLALVTLGFYSLVWLWKTSAELDRFRGRRHAHPPLRAGVVLVLLAIIFLIGIVSVGIALAFTGGDPPRAVGVINGLFLGAACVAGLVGTALLLVGHWRIWTAVRHLQQRLRQADPLSPPRMLLFTLLPGLSIVTYFVMLYMTQARVNRIWRAHS